MIWKLEDFSWGGPSIADGYLITCNQYDNLIYCIGKGPSATTVEAPLTDTTAGSTEMIQGTVTDQSPGAKVEGPKLGFTNGVPAVSEASEEAWMEYIYEQQLKPTNATGVPVSIDAIDPNGNYIHIGDATSDTSGNFGYAWTAPNVPGKYTIYATFAGSNSYGSSSAETNTYVSGAPAATAAPTSTPTSVADTYFVPAIASIIVVIIIGFIVLALLMLRKRP